MTSLMAILMAVSCSAPTDPGLQHAEDITDDPPTAPPAMDTPGQVSDLIVTDSSGTSVTLSFTEVDDGSGQPADYAVRAHIGPMDWGSAEEVTHGTCAAPVRGSTIGARMSCTVENLLPETTYTFQVAAFRGTFQAGAVYGELSNVVPDMGEPPSSGTQENEPDSYQLISSRSFNQIGEGDWTDNTSDSDYSVGVTEAGSASDLVARARYRAGTTGGGAPIGTGTALNFGDRSELYVEFWVKFSDNFQGHDSGVNKILFITDQSYGGGGDPAFIAAYGANSSSLTLHIRLQGPGSEQSASIGSANLRPNLGSSGSIQRGQWYRVELVLVMNTGTNHNGEAHAWLNGNKVTEYRDVRFEDASGSDHRFDNVRWNPTWGGMNDVVENDMYMWMDDIYVSGV